MLFDLRGTGRRRTVKVVYITLAFLMGGGLVLFGIGGDVSGGLVDVITDARPTASTFTQLAVFAYQAGQTRKGDLARDKALELTDPDMREALKGQLEQAKQESVQQALQDATGN